jgi:catalase
MSPPEQDHNAAAFSFELGKCPREEVRDPMLANLANVSAVLTERVVAALGKPTPKSGPAHEVVASAALSLSRRSRD